MAVCHLRADGPGLRDHGAREVAAGGAAGGEVGAVDDGEAEAARGHGVEVGGFAGVEGDLEAGDVGVGEEGF